jgi:hypothetical protein
MRSSLQFILGATLGALVYAPPCHAADPRIEKVLKDWSERRKEVETVEYVIKGRRLFEKGSRTHHRSLPPGTVGEVPPEDVWGKSNHTSAFDFKTGRFRVVSDRELFSLIELKPVAYWDSYMFDGNELVDYQPRERNPGFKSPFQPELILHPAIGGYVNDPERICLAADGMFTFGREPSEKNMFRVELDDYQIEVLAEERIGDRQVTVLLFILLKKPDYSWEVAVDVERQSAILEVTSAYQGRKTRETRIEVENIDGRWMPRRLKTMHSTRPPNDRTECEVTTRRLNPKLPIEEFQAPRKPGMVVHDRQAGQDLRIGPDGKTLAPLERPGRGND